MAILESSRNENGMDDHISLAEGTAKAKGNAGP
jgi:hypothetical protein